MTDPESAPSVVMVTGAASGIGAAVATAFRSRGNCVAVIDRAFSIADSLHGYRLDVTDAAAVSETVAAVEADLGPIGTLVNCAGVLHPSALLETDPKDWNDMMQVNATGVLAATQAVARVMVPRRSGSIVTVASNAASVPRTKIGAYAASKAAASHLTRCFGLELAAYGVRCNVVAPGSTDTPMLMTSLTNGDPSTVLEGDLSQFRLGIPLGRIATTDDIADAVLFLASPQARHITMQELTVDGGASLN